jgi:hypothetical protein
MFDAHPAVAASPATESVTPDTTSTTVQTPAQDTVESPAAAPNPTQQSPQVQGQQQEPAPYTPNYKFTVRNKEHEIDDFLRGAITSQEHEKKVKELYEKAMGLDIVKPKFTETLQERDSFKQKVDHYDRSVQELKDHFSRGDLDKFFKILGVPEEKVLQWFVSKAEYNQLPPEQRKVLDEKRAAEEKAYALEKQQGEYQQRMLELQSTAKDYEIQVTLARPDIKPLADAFDARAGKPGAFVESMRLVGDYAWKSSGGQVDLTPEQAIQQVLQYWGNPLQQAQPPVVPVQQTPVNQHIPQAPKKTPTIPNVAGKQSSSAARAKPKSIEELKQRARELNGG